MTTTSVNIVYRDKVLCLDAAAFAKLGLELGKTYRVVTAFGTIAEAVLEPSLYVDAFVNQDTQMVCAVEGDNTLLVYDRTRPLLPDGPYMIPAKVQARAAIWQAAKERLTCPVQEAVAVYLGGEADYDRDVALSLGFRPYKLFLVEHERRIFDQLRLKGKQAVFGELAAVVQNWPLTTDDTSHQVNFLYADFQCGLVESATVMQQHLVSRDEFKDCVLAVNMLRGREVGGDAQRLVRHGKHRAKAYAHMVFDELERQLALILPREEASSLARKARFEAQRSWIFGTYRSSPQTSFDWCVWKHVTVGTVLAKRAGTDALKAPVSVGNDKHLTQRIIAIQAIGTWRENKHKQQ